MKSGRSVANLTWTLQRSCTKDFFWLLPFKRPRGSCGFTAAGGCWSNQIPAMATNKKQSSMGVQEASLELAPHLLISKQTRLN